jgi:methyl-accepting chemotaxis protein
VFVALGIALLVQVLVAVALTRSTVTALEADLGERLGHDSQKLAAELEQAGQDVRAGLDSLCQYPSAPERRPFRAAAKRAAATARDPGKEPEGLANDMAELLASVAPRAIWDNDVPMLSDFARRAQRNPNVLFVIYDDAQGQHLTRYLNRQNPINQALMDKGQASGRWTRCWMRRARTLRCTSSKRPSAPMAPRSARC